MASRPLLFYSALYGGTTALQKGLGFLLFLWVARVVSIEEYGRFGLYYALQQGIVTLATAGVVEAVVGLLKVHADRSQRISLFAAARTGFAALLLLAIACAAAAWSPMVGHSRISLATYVGVVCSGILLALSSFQSQLVRLEEQHAWSVLLSTMPPGTALLAAFVAFIQFRSVQSFFVGSAIGALISTIALWGARRSAWRLSQDLRQIRRILALGVPFAVVAALGWLSGYGNNYLINVILERADVARFTLALSVCSILLLVAGALNQVWCPRFYRLIGEQPFALVERQNRRFYRVLPVLLGFTGGLITVFFPQAAALGAGNLRSYATMSSELALLLAGTVVLAPWWHCHNHFLANGMGRSVLNIAAGTSFAGVLCLVLLMVVVGPMGIYIGFFLQMILRSLAIALIARRHWAVEVDWIGPCVGVAMIVVGLMCQSGIPGTVLTVLCYAVVCGVLAIATVGHDVRHLVRA